MNSKTYILLYNDGSIGFMTVYEQTRVTHTEDGDMVEYYMPVPADELKKWPEAARSTVKSYREIDPALIPTDRTFRDAWRDGGNTKVKIDMKRARDVWREKMRKVRKPLLEALDVEYQRADERDDTNAKTAIAQRKERLRDVTDHPDIADARTPDELKEVWPEELTNE